MKPIFSRVLIPKKDFRPVPDARFLSSAYKKAYGSEHQGADYNGILGGDSDIGTFIHSPFNGHVVFVDNRKGTGNIIMIRADEYTRRHFEIALGLELPVLDALFMHLYRVNSCMIPHSSKDRILVSAGDVVGSMGKGNTNSTGWRKIWNIGYYAHLHMEVRIVKSNKYIPQHKRTKKEIMETHINPELFFAVADFGDRTNVAPTYKHRLGHYRAIEVDGNTVLGIYDHSRARVVSNINQKMFIKKPE